MCLDLVYIIKMNDRAYHVCSKDRLNKEFLKTRRYGYVYLSHCM